MSIRQRTVRRVAVVVKPIDGLGEFVDEVVVVDGSADAYDIAFNELRRRVRLGELDADDVVFTIDAHGPHELSALDDLHLIMVDEDLDALLVGRDLSKERVGKRLRTYATSAWSSLWAGGRVTDVEAGYRMFRIGALAHALDYCRGYAYSETVEVAVVLKRLGYRVRADLVAPMPRRSSARAKDLALDAAMVPLAAWRSTRPLGRVGRLKALAVPVVVSAAPIATAIALGRVSRRRP